VRNACSARLLAWAAGTAGPKWPEVKVFFVFYFPEASLDAYFDDFRFNFDANFCANFYPMILFVVSKVILVLLENIIVRMFT
jgi:hypothetical protein